MTDPEYENTIIVMAGFENEINEMLNTAPGLKSRFTQTIKFPNWTVEDCAGLFTKILENENFEVGEGVLDIVKTMCGALIVARLGEYQRHERYH